MPTARDPRYAGVEDVGDVEMDGGRLGLLKFAAVR